MNANACEPFAVRDDKTAEWCLQKIREAKAEKQMWADYYAAQKKSVDAEADRTIAFFEAALEDYFAIVPHKKAKTQESYSLPGGKLVRKHQPPEYIRDDAALLPWLRDNMADCIRTAETVDWAELKQRLTITPGGALSDDNGEIVPGVQAVARPDVFRVEA